jgi:hypothetical protein
MTSLLGVAAHRYRKLGKVAEVEGYYQGRYYWKWGAGFYTVLGSTLTATIVGEGSKNGSTRIHVG